MKILVVDDEEISRTVLLKKMELIGECTPATNAREALISFAKALQDKAPFDLITLDVSMPGMDGRKVLANMRRHERANGVAEAHRARIIMVSARMNISTIKECIRLGCNNYLTKPVSRYQLMDALGKLGLELPQGLETSEKNPHSRLVTDIIRQFYNGKIKLPVFPEIVLEVDALVLSETPSIDALEQIIKKDIVISSRLISIANSPLYKGVDHAETLNAALVRLGIKAAHQVVTSVAAKTLFDAEQAQLNTMLQELWMHSFATACLARILGEKLEMENLDTLFLMGIIHDIGKVLLLKAYSDIAEEPDLEDLELQTAIHEIHTTFGGVLLKKLRFSDDFVQVAECHHWNLYTQDCPREYIIINLANHLSQFLGHGFIPLSPREKNLEHALKNLRSFRQLELDLETVEAVLEKGRAMVAHTADDL